MDKTPETTFEQLVAEVRLFAKNRDWQQFHTPRNLVLALSGEIGELAAEFQWISDVEVDEALKAQAKHDHVARELADVFIYLIYLSDVLKIDLISVALNKIEENEFRYPVDQVRGSSAKYTAYES